MKLGYPKRWFILAPACIGLASLSLYLILQSPDVNAYHPPERSLWQAYNWAYETRLGLYGLEDWRLEGINTSTAIYFGRFQYYDLPLSAPGVAALGFAGISALGLLGFMGLRLLFRRRRPPLNPSRQPTPGGRLSVFRALLARRGCARR